MVVFGGVNSDEDLNDVALWKPVLSERKLSLPRNESEVLIHRPQGLRSTGAETIAGDPFNSARGIDLSSTASKGLTMEQCTPLSGPLPLSMPSTDGPFAASQSLPAESLSQHTLPLAGNFDSAPRN